MTAGGGGSRRLLVGLDADGRSAVVREDVAAARVVRPNGALIEEIWRHESLPTTSAADGSRTGEPGAPPPEGVSVRIFTLPPDSEGAAPVLAASTNHFVATVVSGAAHLVLETGPVGIEQGDSFVLPGSTHGWSNPYDVPAVIVTTVVAIAD
jgi:mannose-6-phosphate isomerase-like protein (cupin superfamily)